MGTLVSKHFPLGTDVTLTEAFFSTGIGSASSQTHDNCMMAAAPVPPLIDLVDDDIEIQSINPNASTSALVPTKNPNTSTSTLVLPKNPNTSSIAGPSGTKHPSRRPAFNPRFGQLRYRAHSLNSPRTFHAPSSSRSGLSPKIRPGQNANVTLHGKTNVSVSLPGDSQLNVAPVLPRADNSKLPEDIALPELLEGSDDNSDYLDEAEDSFFAESEDFIEDCIDIIFDVTMGDGADGDTDGTKDQPTVVPPPDETEIATVPAPKVQFQHQHLKALVEWFPLVELKELQGICKTFGPNASLETLVSSIMDSQELPAQDAPAASLEAVQHQVLDMAQEEVRDVGVEAARDAPARDAPAQERGRQHQNVMYLSEMFPDLLVEEVERRCAEFDPEESLEVMINAFLEDPVPVNDDLEHGLADLSVAASERTVREIEIEEQRGLDVLQQRLAYLREIFPDVDPAVLQDRCAEHGVEAPMEDVVASLFASHGGDVDDDVAGVAAETTEADLELLNAYQSVLNILPEADPDYLREKFEMIGKNENAWKLFVADALETGDYPTYEDYARRQVTVKLQRKFRENFSVKDFVETYPDPFKHFREKVSAVDKSYMPHQNAFLRSRYWFLTDDDIQIVHTEKKYNLYSTCKELDKVATPAENRPDFDAYLECYTDVTSQELLEEIAFIENEDRVTQYMNKQKKEEKAALERARKNLELLTCGCCYDESVLPKSMTSCVDGHLFCKDCVRKSAQVLIGMGKTAFPCLSDCGKNISWKALKEVLNPTVFSRVCQRQQLEEVQAANIQDLEVCPFCDFGAIPLETDIVFTCLNPDCMIISCRLCKEQNHIPLHCDELPEKDEQVKLRTYIEDRMTDALVRECWQCHKKFIKSDGCNKMTCSCGAIMCYLCRKPVKDYSHFNGQGGDKLHLCPLWSKNAELHERAVEKEAMKAKKEVETLNPTVTLKHDPTLVLP